MTTLSQNQYGIAIFHNIGDILLCTPIARQLKADDPACHITWYISQRYAFVLDNNPYIDEVVALPDVPLHDCQIIGILQPHATPQNAGVLALNAEIPRLRTMRPWTRFFTPAAYLNYGELAKLGPNGSLLDIIKSYVNFTWTVPDLPVMRLTDVEVENAHEYISGLPAGIRILIETEFNSSQSYFDVDCLMTIITATIHLKPVIIFTAKNKPFYFDDLSKIYERLYWFSGDFRLNAELYNACNGYVGVSSGISTLTYSDWCRNDLPKLEASLGEHWSAYQRVSHYRLMPCYSKEIFLATIPRFVSMLQETMSCEAKYSLTETTPATIRPAEKLSPAVVIDGVIFQLQHGRPFGISRLWLSLLTKLAATRLAGRIVLLDRYGTAPEIPGIRRRRVSPFQLGNAQDESPGLDRVCGEENAGLFISTYYTFTTSTPSLLMLYDMIPERIDTVGPDAPNPEWRDKYHAIVNSSAFAAISQSTASDLDVFYPQTIDRPLTVIPCAVADDFRVHTEEEIAAFKAVNGIDRPYFLLVGRRDPHKNAALFFQAFARLPERERYAIVMAGGGNALEPELRELAGPAAGYAGFFSDQDLSLAYSGAIALVYPSLYEGFGLPILEAMQSGCPVITCQNSSLQEVAGSAALYVGEHNPQEMSQALLAVQQPDVRGYLIKRGLERARMFSWQKSAELLAEVIRKSVDVPGMNQAPGDK